MEPRQVLPPLDVAQRTDPGRDPDKQVNEDSCGSRETAFGMLCVVCDGMGGHQNGREASILALEAIFEAFEAAAKRPDGAPTPGTFGARGRELLKQAVLAANQRVCDLGGAFVSKQGRPGSTVVALLAHPEGVEVAHVGDSRCYMVQGGQIFQITKDHTVVQRMVDAQLLTPEQAAVHPDANQILRALGTSPELDVEVRQQSLAFPPGDAFVLCSDGLSDLVDAPEILRVVSSVPPGQAVAELVDIANAKGGHDNITAVVLRHPASTGGTREPVPTLAQTVFELPMLPAVAPAAAQAAAANVPLYTPGPSPAPGFSPAPSVPAGPGPSQAPPAGHGSGPAPAMTAPLAATLASIPGPVPAHASGPAPALGSGPALPAAPASDPSPRSQPPVPGAVMLPHDASPPRPARRSISIAVVLGVVLAVIGFGAAGFFIYLLVNPGTKPVAPFATTRPITSAASSGVSLVPVAPEPPASAPAPAVSDGGPVPAPLPSLVPSPHQHHGHGP